MKISLATSAPAQLETECLAVTVIDTGDKKPAPGVLSSDSAVVAATADLIASGEVTGKIFETVMLHKPAGVKAKRLLFVGGIAFGVVVEALPSLVDDLKERVAEWRRLRQFTVRTKAA